MGTGRDGQPHPLLLSELHLPLCRMELSRAPRSNPGSKKRACHAGSCVTCSSRDLLAFLPEEWSLSEKQ